MVDTNIFIRFEKSGNDIDLSSWNDSDEVYISAIVASELLIIHRADTDARRLRRSSNVLSPKSKF